MNIVAIIQYVQGHKEDFVALIGAVVTVASIVLHLLPAPTETSGKLYSFLYNVIHKIALNKKA